MAARHIRCAGPPLTLALALGLAGCADSFSSPIEDDVGPAPTCESVSTWESAWSDLEYELADAVNAARGAARTCGDVEVPQTRGLEFDPHLRCAARRRARFANVNGTLASVDENGRNAIERAYAAEYPDIPRGEIIARGQRNASAVVEAFLASPEHCEILMDRNFDEIGTGVYDAAQAEGAGPVWVISFGRHR